MLLTALLQQVTPGHLAGYFNERKLTCSQARDLPMLQQLLLAVCRFAGGYDVSTIKWPGKVPALSVLPYIESNLADFSVSLIEYEP